jgi:hypothetical protein
LIGAGSLLPARRSSRAPPARSAATPKADAGVSAIFAAYMKKDTPTVPSPPPAEACPATVVPGVQQN